MLSTWGGGHEETKPIDDPISFPSINLNKVIVPHYDALILTLCISGFDVHKVLVDPGSEADLLQLPAFNQMKLSSGMLNSARQILFGFNDITTTTLGDAPYTSRTSHPAGFVLSRRRLGAIQCYSWPSLAALDEGRLFNISPDGRSFDQHGASQPSKQSVGRTIVLSTIHTRT